MAGAYSRWRLWLATRPFIESRRRARYELFVRVCSIKPGDRLLDVGAGQGTALERYQRGNPIVALDILEENRPYHDRWENVEFVAGDALALPFPDTSFEVVFSTSLIEHLPRSERERYAGEIRRVASRYFVQTPNKHFPIEPHYMLPLAQFLPRRARRLLDRRLLDDEGEIELLNADELGRLFPDATIHRERVLGLTKSLMAVKGAQSQPEPLPGLGSG